MRGSLLITYFDYDGFGGDYLDIIQNGLIQKRLYSNSNNLYSIPLELNDVITIQFSDLSPFQNPYISLIRKDYTTDNNLGDNGIKQTNIITALSGNSYTFTATTINGAYDFYYYLDLSLSSCINIGSGFDNTVLKVNVTSDGYIYCNGDFTSYSGVSRNGLIRLHPNGNNDNDFVIGTGFDNTVYSTAIQSDNKIVVGGLFNSYSGQTIPRLTRLNFDGSIDNTFVMGTGGNGDVRDIKIQSDDKILIGGSSNLYSGQTVNRLYRLNTNGSLDTTFVFTYPLSSPVHIVQLQSDNKIVIGGFDDVILRVNTNGSIDSSFTIGTLAGINRNPEAIAILPNGKILVGGTFSSYNGVSKNNIVLLNSDGTIDNTFNIGTGFNQVVDTIEVQDDGKIIVGGNFTSYNGTSVNRIVRLNINGSIDNTFVVGTGFNNRVRDVYVDEDGNIITVGQFILYNGTLANRIIKLKSNGSENLCP